MYWVRLGSGPSEASCLIWLPISHRRSYFDGQKSRNDHLKKQIKVAIESYDCTAPYATHSFTSQQSGRESKGGG